MQNLERAMGARRRSPSQHPLRQACSWLATSRSGSKSPSTCKKERTVSGILKLNSNLARATTGSWWTASGATTRNARCKYRTRSAAGMQFDKLPSELCTRPEELAERFSRPFPIATRIFGGRPVCKSDRNTRSSTKPSISTRD
jgi:hypothetical protein